MGFTCSIDAEARLGRVEVHGVVDVQVFLGMMETLYRHPHWQPGYAALWDARGITKLLLSPHETERIVAFMRELEPYMGEGRAAFVVPREIDYIIARLLIFRGLHSKRERRAFTSMHEAQAWLDEPASGAARAAG